MYTDVDVADSEGRMLPDLDAARQHARSLARATVIEKVQNGEVASLDHHIDVEDEHGTVVATIHYSEQVAQT